MKKSAMVLAMVLVLPLFLQSPTYAALTEVNMPLVAGANNKILKNNIAYLDSGTYPGENSAKSNTTSIDNPSQYTENFSLWTWLSGSNYTGVTFTGTAATSSTRVNENSISASAYTSMTYTGFTDATDIPGITVTQSLQAKYTQTYYDPTANGQLMEISGLLDLSGLVDNDGNITFDLLDTDIFSSYSISGMILVESFTVSSTSANSVVTSVTLNDGITSGSAYFNMESGDYSSSNTDDWSGTYYTVTAALTISAELDNYNQTGTAAALDGAEFVIGNSTNPITITALLEPAAVPVPSAFLLLISGVAGLSFIRRRQS